MRNWSLLDWWMLLLLVLLLNDCLVTRLMHWYHLILELWFILMIIPLLWLLLFPLNHLRIIHLLRLLLLLLLSESFGLQLFSIVLEEHVVLVYSHLDILQESAFAGSSILRWEKLVLSDTSLLECHDQFLAISDDVIGEICPFELGLVQHSFGIGFFLLKYHHVFLHEFKTVRQALILA